MNDDEVLDAVKQTLSDVRMDRPVEAIERRGRTRRRNRTLIGAAAGGGLAAVAALVVILPMAAGSGTGPAGPGAQPPGAAAPPGSDSPPAGSDSPALTGNVKLVSLAAGITAEGNALPGDASLVVEKVEVRRAALPSRTRFHLYADSGEYYYTEAKGALPGVVARRENLGNGFHSRGVAAARYAVTGDLAEAREKMINSAYDDGRAPSAAEQERARQEAYRRKGVTNPPPVTDEDRENSANNHVWIFSVDTLAAAGGNPEVRAGVLRLLSTISDVTVTDSTTQGRPTLTIAAGPALFGGDGEQVLVVDARNGVPISSTMKDPTGTSFVQTFKISRVKVADVKAGRF